MFEDWTCFGTETKATAMKVIKDHMSHRKNPGNTKYVLDGHWFMEIDGNC